MRLFKRQRNCPKPEPPSSTDDSQKSRAVFRFFQNSANGTLLSKETTTADVTGVAAAAAVICPDETRLRQLHSVAADSLDDCSPVNYSFLNQNYTPEVALSPESRPMSPAELPLIQSQYVDGHNCGDTATANNAGKSMDLERYELWQQKKPRFHVGPRAQDDAAGSTDRRASGITSVSSSVSEHLITLPPKFAFIYQDGKFVEREVTQWPTPERSVPHLRYRIQEPYASHYGRWYKKRLASQERVVTQRERCIYQNPIYRLPRKIMEENKFRLMTRHCLKDSFEGPIATIGPRKVHINEQEQAKISKNIVDKQNYKEAEKLVSHLTAKSKADKVA